MSYFYFSVYICLMIISGKNNSNSLIQLGIIMALGTLYHMWGFSLNDVLKVADSFAYLQMSYYLQELSAEWFGTWWFGFLYSLPIAVVDVFLGQDFFSGKLVNLILFNISALVLWKISTQFLSQKWSLLVIVLWFCSPILLHFNIHILSENMYILLFLLLVYNLLSYFRGPNFRQTLIIAGLLWCMYLTRAEAFIYLLSVLILATIAVTKNRMSLKEYFWYGGVFILTFFVFISPYLIHLHSITWEWGLTNKWASNVRQAELRGIEKMDDAWFEQAVAELTPDKHHLIGGFAWGMAYDPPQIGKTFKEFVAESPSDFFERILSNQKKLYTKNLPEIFLGKSPSLYISNNSRLWWNPLFLILILIPLIVLVYWLFELWRKQKDLFWIGFSFFIVAWVFFTFFFVLDRYFLIFFPLLLIGFAFGLQQLGGSKKRIIQYGCTWLWVLSIFAIYILSNLVYINTESPKDAYYELKAQAGIWLKENSQTPPDIMERFPIVTYYSGSKHRWITPYESEIENIIEYAKYNSIDIFVVDTMDFLTYRPFLADYLVETPEWLTKLKEFTNRKGQKVILYKFPK